MNELHPVIEQALRPYMPASQPTDAALIEADRAIEQWKAGYQERNSQAALSLQIKSNPEFWL
jgi:hypothetical protein